MSEMGDEESERIFGEMVDRMGLSFDEQSRLEAIDRLACFVVHEKRAVGRVRALLDDHTVFGVVLLRDNPYVRDDDFMTIALGESVKNGVYLPARKLGLWVENRETGLLAVIEDDNTPDSWVERTLNIGTYIDPWSSQNPDHRAKLNGILRQDENVMVDFSGSGFHGSEETVEYLQQPLEKLWFYGQRFF